MSDVPTGAAGGEPAAKLRPASAGAGAPPSSPLAAAPSPWTARAGQAAAIFRLELRKLLLAPGALALALLAALPAVLFGGIWLVASLVGRVRALADITGDFASSFQAFTVPLVVFFGCVVVFTNLVRRELRDRTLHHYLLAPVRRELVVAAKFAAGLAATSLAFGAGTVASFALAYGPCLSTDRLALSRFFLDGPGLAHLAAYLSVVLLACLGYGAVFLAVGLWFRGPVLPALTIFGWEMFNGLLPPAFKKLSVFTYLHAFFPVPVDADTFALLAESPPPWLAVPALLVLSAVLLALSARRFRRLEVLYAED